MIKRCLNSNNDPEGDLGVFAEPTRQPIAIVGIGCRFPGGADDPESYWELLAKGVDAITEIPPDRWNMDRFYDPDPGTPGKSYARHGGFIKGIDLFDPAFFGISHREASFMDPQQKLLLEVAWEALEDAGLVIDRKIPTNAGVFIGISSYDFLKIQPGLWDMESFNAHSGTGIAFSIAANRISYALNLTGPSLAVDTACSSSLMAVHLACESLWKKECRLALAGGVNVLLSPESYVSFCRLSMLAPDGRCKTFDARADGYVRGEGAGLVVLKTLAQAVRDHDSIYALIRGSVANQDGRTPGITVPNILSQEALLRQACQAAGINPGDVTFIEAHGTGTPVGDPIEAQAIGTVLGKEHPAEIPCFVGSVKTNIGHLESAAGAAGLIKAALMVKRRMIPPNLHFKEPNPQIDFAGLHLCVPVSLLAWPEHQPVIASVNSFGFGGTNAQVILSSPPEAKIKRAPAERPQIRDYEILCLSANSPESLLAHARDFKNMLDGTAWAETSLRDICRTAGMRRFHHPHRLSIVAESRQQLAGQLGVFLKRETAAGIACAQSMSPEMFKLVFVFSGQGPQWWAMGRELLRKEPVFRKTILRSHEILRAYAGWSLLEELEADEKSSRLEQTAIAQPSIFALQAALTALWGSWGIRADAVVGHSVGEVAAAYTGGILSLEDALRVITHRGRLMNRVSSEGRMMAVGLNSKDVRAYFRNGEEGVHIAAVNSPEAVTLSGDRAVLERIEKALVRDNVFCQFLRVNYAFHSHHMEGMREELLESLDGIQTHPPSLTVYSTVSGSPAAPEDFSAAYWWRNVRQPVNFAGAMEDLIRKEHTVFLEVGPHPVLSSSITECLLHAERRGWVLPSLRRREPDRFTLLSSLGALHTLGAKVNWKALYPESGPAVKLPKYPWNRERCWSQPENVRDFLLGPEDHPLLGRKLSSPLPAWENRINNWLLGYMKDHCVQGQALIPATAFIEIALAAGRSQGGDGFPVLEDIRFHKPLFLSEGQNITLRTQFDPERMTLHIHNNPNGGRSSWQLNASGRILPADKVQSRKVSLEAIRGRLKRQMAGADCYKEFHRAGIDYGPSFLGIQKLYCGEGESLAEIAVPEGLLAGLEKYEFHPAVFDACLQAIIGSFVSADATSYLPVLIERLRVLRRPGSRVWSHVKEAKKTVNGIEASLQILDEEGSVIAEVQGLQAQGLKEGKSGDIDDLLYGYRWIPISREKASLRSDSLENLPSLHEILAETRLYGVSLKSSLTPEELNQISTCFVVDSFLKLGWNPRAGERFSFESLIASLGVADAHRRLFERFLRILEEDGLIFHSAGEWEVRKAFAGRETRTWWQSLLAKYPGCYPMLSLILRCGESLAEVLRGRINPLELIFPGGDFSLVEQLYQDTPQIRYFNLLVQHSLGRMISALPRRRRIRFIEIGAGTGSTTSYVLPALPKQDVDYVFTDISAIFLENAKQKFSDESFISYELLDIERGPEEQGFEAHSYDIVIAAHVLHAARDLGTTLMNIKRLLSSGGVLVLLETVKPLRWIDLTFGLLEGWWNFTDTDLRPEYPTLPLPKWRELLKKSEFGEINEFAVPDGPGTEPEAALIIARGPCFATEPKRPEPNSVKPEVKGNWLIFDDCMHTGRRLADRLEKDGGQCVLVSHGESFRSLKSRRFEVSPESKAHLDRLLDLMDNDGDHVPFRGIVQFWSLDSPPFESIRDEDFYGAFQLSCFHVLLLLQGLMALEGREPPRLWLVTRKAVSVENNPEPIWPIPSALWGLARVIVHEYPRLRSTMVDLGPAGESSRDLEKDIQSLYEELWSENGEDEIALRGGIRYVHRLMRTSLLSFRPAGSSDHGENDGVRLEVSKPGLLENLIIRQSGRRSPGNAELEIRVEAAGLNFSDVMKALNLYPGLAEGDVPLGIECAGVVIRTGGKVKDFRPGDRVMSLASRSFSSHVTVPETFVMPLPGTLDFAEAATIPVAFLTAYYALVQQAKLERGERVLIHSATGGVGLAALQVARHVGARVFATAGTEEKRKLLRDLGVELVMDSRSLSFASEIMECTLGAGVDVVLNSLSGEAMARGLSVLRSYGRFLEIGKKDIYLNRDIGLLPFKNNLSFFSIDLERTIREQPALVSSILERISIELSRGNFSPLPFRQFPLSMAPDAFRLMAKAKHIGKLVLTINDHIQQVAPPFPASASFKKDAAYLITGGLGGFGLLVADWMVENGARHMALMGRSGAAGEEALKMIAAMERKGAEIRVIRGDVSKEKDVRRALAEIREDMPPLRGVIHAAMVLDDDLLMNLTAERMVKVMDPKIRGAWNLHHQTCSLPLDFFILFSSVSSMIGNPGQGSYVAANAFLDAFSHYRRAQGLPSCTINWGYLGEVGAVARSKEISSHFEKLGMESFSPRQATELLARFLKVNPVQIGVIKMDWSRLGEVFPAFATLPKYAHLSSHEAAVREDNGVPQSGGPPLLASLLKAGVEERMELLEAALADQVAKILGASAAKLDIEKPLTEHGFDSLMAVELRNWIERHLEANLSTMEIMRGPSIRVLTRKLQETLNNAVPKGSGQPNSVEK